MRVVTLTTATGLQRETGRGLGPRPVTAARKGVALQYSKVVLAEPSPRFPGAMGERAGYHKA